MKNKVLLIYSWFVRSFLFLLPDTPVLMRFRGFLYSFGMANCGKDFQITHDAIVRGLQNLSVGNNVFIGNHAIILASNNIVIANEVMIAPHCTIVDGEHSNLNGSFRYGPSKTGVVFIDHGAWIGANSTVTMNSFLPKGSVLGANSFLNKKFNQEESLYSGSPAKFVKRL
jgi:maltose O-acetyltransferase